AALHRPLLGAGGHVLYLLLVTGKGVAADPVVLRTGGQGNTQVAACEVVVGGGVEQLVVDEQGLAFAALDHAVITGLPPLHVGDEVVGGGRVGDEVHQDAVVAVIFGAVVLDRQHAALHQRIDGTGTAGGVADYPVALGEHVVDAEAKVLHQVALHQVVVRVAQIDAVAGMA